MPAATRPVDACDAWVDCYDAAAFAAGVPSLRKSMRAGDQPVQADDILCSRLVTAPRRAWVVGPDRGRTQLASRDWLVLRAHAFDPVYLRHLLVSNEFHLRFVRAAADRGRQQLVHAGDVARIEIPAPPLAEQQAIARVLACADELRAKRNQVAAQLAELPRALLRELAAEGDGAPWPRVRLRDLLAAEPAPDGLPVTDARERAWLLVGAANLRRDGVDPSGARTVAADAQRTRRCAVGEGDLLVAPSEASSDMYAVVARPSGGHWLCDDNVIRLRLDPARLDPELARELLLSDAVRPRLVARWTRHRRGAPHGPQTIATLEIPMPPASAQAKFLAFSSAARDLEGKLHASARQLDTLLGGLRDAAFRGELTTG